MTTERTTEYIKYDQTSEIIKIPVSINFRYKWKLQNENKLSNGYSTESPMFSNESNEINWRLKITMDESYDCYKIELKPIIYESTISSLTANCTFKLFDSTRRNTETWKILKNFELLGKYLRCFEIEKEDIYLMDGDYIITCEINVQQISKPLAMPKCTLGDNYELIFENHKFSDVTLCASDKEFKAHKAILAAQSPVFDAMFGHDMEEAKTNRVNIPDIDGEVLQELLRFIYTGKVCNLEKLASDLLPPAEKYGFVRLKILCGKALWESISNENAAEIYVLTHVYNLDQLKAIVRKYISNNVIDVVNTAGWNLITQSYPSLITEVLCDVAKKQIHKKVIKE